MLPRWSQQASLLPQLLEHFVQIQDLKRRCAEKDQALRPLEQQVQQLQNDRHRIEQDLEEANRDRCCALLCHVMLCWAMLCRIVGDAMLSWLFGLWRPTQTSSA